MQHQSDKKYFRLQSVKKIKVLSDKQKQECSKKLMHVFLDSVDLTKNIKSVAVYAYDSTEISVDFIAEALLEQGLTVSFPVIESGAMSFYAVKSLSDLSLGCYGIRQPKGILANKVDTFDLMLIPGRAFDTLGNRIGRGAGYYDKFLELHSCTYKVGVAFDFQVYSKVLPVESHDIAVKAVMTEKKFYKAD
ncbi:5-formyltetrahydrofolate cyclo-ligase [bacterium]|nr:5-formyltetrahydrofolate cyclo-ligase [bacterium]